MKDDFFLILKNVFAAVNEERVAWGLKPIAHQDTLRKRLKKGECRVRFYSGKKPRYSLNDARAIVFGNTSRKKHWSKEKRQKQAFVIQAVWEAQRSRDMRAYGEHKLTAKQALEVFNTVRRAAGRKPIKSINAWHTQAKRKNIPTVRGKVLTFFDAVDIVRWAVAPDERRGYNKVGAQEASLPKAPREIELSGEWISCNEFAKVADIHVTTVRRHVYEGDLEGYVTSRLHEVLIHARTAAEFFLERANNFRRRRK